MWRLPTRIRIGRGALCPGLGAVLSESQARRAVLVTDVGVGATDFAAKAKAAMEAHCDSVHVFDAVEPNPRLSTVDSLADFCRSAGADLVVGLGGGSVLDAGKAAAMLVNNEGSALQFEGKNIFSNASVPFIACPTTCGTGSEVTWVSVITHDEEKRKFSVKGDGMFPATAIVDADVLTSLPSAVVRDTSIDALTHALEAYLCPPGVANPISDALATQAVALILQNLQAAIDPTSEEAGRAAQDRIMEAATVAGMAFGNADVAAVHCISETIGGLWDVPHGLGNAIFLAPVLSHYGPCVEARLATLYRAVAGPSAHSASDAEAAGAMLCRVEALVESLGVPSFNSLNIAESEDSRIAEIAVSNGSNGSCPRVMETADYLKILAQARRR